MVQFFKKRKKDDEFKYTEIFLNKSGANKKGSVDNSVHSTRYTVYNFLHKNLLNQLRRISNIYFLTVAIITLIPLISPFSPYSAWLPWCIILSVSAAKDIIEDLRRWRFDYRVNHRLYQIVRDGTIKTMYSENITAGDIVIVHYNEEVPADMILLGCSNEEGTVFLDMSNLDGESNLKAYHVMCETKNLTLENVLNFHALILVGKNTVDLYKFKAVLELDSSKVMLNEKNLILRGCYLRNGSYMLGGVVYTGNNTKILLNAGVNFTKLSKTDIMIDRVITVVFVLKMLLCLVLSFVNSLLESNFLNMTNFFGMQENNGVFVQGLMMFWSYFALFSYFIPISLVITLDIVRLIQSVFMEWDLKMRRSAPHGMSVKNSALNDELARTDFVLCDKTGTLTQNVMHFRECSVSGKVYKGIQLAQAAKKINSKEGKKCLKFMLSLAIVNTVMVQNKLKEGLDGGEQVIEVKRGSASEQGYCGQSTDELCMCRHASEAGVVLEERDVNSVSVRVFGKLLRVEVLRIIEFTSERRRMSIIVKFEDGSIEVLSKGSDSEMFASMSSENKQRLMSKTEQHASRFNSKGWRTMTFAYKKIEPIEYSTISNSIQELMTNRASIGEENDTEEQLSALLNQIESNMMLMGCVGMEDRLQRRVPHTIRTLTSVGIHVWMITGDKQATAVSIFQLCNASRSDRKHQRVLCITGCESKEQYEECMISALNHFESDTTQCRTLLVVDGISLNRALEDQQRFLSLSLRCTSVVFCSSTPLQKALIVRMLKSKKNTILAIGDGANDVSMLREAHIGVAIRGKEGLQASRASDYTINSFHLLKRLIFIHGRYNLLRNNTVIYFFFYKCLSTYLVMLWYSIFNVFSAQILYDNIIIAIFNIVYTSLPPIAIGTFDRDLDEKKIFKNFDCHKDVLAESFSISSFFMTLLTSIWHSLCFYFIPHILFYKNSSPTRFGKCLDLLEFGSTIFSGAILTILLKCVLLTHSLNLLITSSILFGLIAYFAILAIQSYWPQFFPQHLHLLSHLFSNPTIIFCVLLTPFTALLPDLTFSYVRRCRWPNKTQTLQKS